MIRMTVSFHKRYFNLWPLQRSGSVGGGAEMVILIFETITGRMKDECVKVA
jgi:hypothetical protein